MLGGGGGQPFALEGDVGAENFPEDAEACRLLAKAGEEQLKADYSREAELSVANATKATAWAAARPGFYEAKGQLLRLIKACERAVEAARKACEGRPATRSELTWHQLACDMWVAGSSLRIARDAYNKLVASKVFAPTGTPWSREEIARFDKAVRETPRKRGGQYDWYIIADLVETRSRTQCEVHFSTLLQQALTNKRRATSKRKPPRPRATGGRWTDSDSIKLKVAYDKSPSNWTLIAAQFDNRTPGACRDRYRTMYGEARPKKHNGAPVGLAAPQGAIPKPRGRAPTLGDGSPAAWDPVKGEWIKPRASRAPKAAAHEQTSSLDPSLT